VCVCVRASHTSFRPHLTDFVYVDVHLFTVLHVQPFQHICGPKNLHYVNALNNNNNNADEEFRTSPLQRASLLAARVPHSGDWLLASPISGCGLWLDNEAVRIVVALRLASDLGSLHTCHCGSLVEANGTHGFFCK